MQARAIVLGFILSILSLTSWLSAAEQQPTNLLQVDFDQDGLVDSLETKLKTDPALADTDGDGLSDGFELGSNPQQPRDSDQNSIINALDWDDDGDHIPTVLESKRDTDQDGLADYLDTDSDNDGESDTQEAGLIGLDNDQDGIDDRFDADLTKGKDQNGDGVDDASVLATAVTTFNQVVSSAEKPKAIPNMPSSSVDTTASLANPNQVLEVEVSETAELSMLVNLPSSVVEGVTKLAKKPDTDGDRLPDELEIGLDPKHPVDTDSDGIFDFLDEDDDGDNVLTVVEGEADRDGDGRVNYLDIDESGYFYCANTGRIIGGIKNFKITPSTDVVLQADAKKGYYRWYPLKPGTYTLQFVLPKGLRTVTELEKGQLYVTSANKALVNLGWNEDINHEGQLARFNSKKLPLWYSSFVIQAGAPPIINHNIPLMGTACDTPKS